MKLNLRHETELILGIYFSNLIFRHYNTIHSFCILAYLYKFINLIMQASINSVSKRETDR